MPRHHSEGHMINACNNNQGGNPHDTDVNPHPIPEEEALGYRIAKSIGASPVLGHNSNIVIQLFPSDSLVTHVR